MKNYSNWGLLWLVFLSANFILLAPDAFGQVSNKLSGCICNVDAQKLTVTVVPWNQEEKSLEKKSAKEVRLTEDTKVSLGKNKNAKITDLRQGKTVIVEGVKALGIPDTEINGLQGLVGWRATFTFKKNTNTVSEMTPDFWFIGESMDATLGVGPSGKTATVQKSPCSCVEN
jgi:hypothetical protein